MTAGNYLLRMLFLKLLVIFEKEELSECYPRMSRGKVIADKKSLNVVLMYEASDTVDIFWN